MMGLTQTWLMVNTPEMEVNDSKELTIKRGLKKVVEWKTDLPVQNDISVSRGSPQAEGHVPSVRTQLIDTPCYVKRMI